MTISDKPICVTGASGFIASRLVSDLLDAGYRVRGTVRDASASDRYSMLTELPGAAERLELVSANLLEPESFEAAIAGCEYVQHTASPYILTVNDPQKDLVDPAVTGTEGVLAAASKAGGVKRVVLTSSVAAITDEPPDRAIDESDWNESSSLTRNPYYYSKVCAEKAAWAYMEAEEREFDLVVVNPFLVIGPSMIPSLNESNKVIVDLLAGKMPAIANLAWGMVDVRDVAKAHVLAMETPEAEGRYLCANETLSMRALVDMLRELGYDKYKLPKMGFDNGFGNVMVKMSSIFQPRGVRSYLKTHLGRVPRFDNGKIQRELGLEFMALRDSVRDTAEDVLRWEHVARRA